MSYSRFFYDEPKPASVADKLLENAEQLEIKLFRREGGNVTALVELHATLGAEFFADDDETDEAEQSRKSTQALADVRQLLAAFAGSRGDA